MNLELLLKKESSGNLIALAKKIPFNYVSDKLVAILYDNSFEIKTFLSDLELQRFKCHEKGRRNFISFEKLSTHQTLITVHENKKIMTAVITANSFDIKYFEDFKTFKSSISEAQVVSALKKLKVA